MSCGWRAEVRFLSLIFLISYYYFKYLMFPTTYIVAVAPAAVAPALTSFSGLLQEVEQYGGCLVHTHLLCVLAARL